MARQTHARENLLRDATALVERAAIQLDASAGDSPEETIVIGFHRDGAASVYFGEEPVLHFNISGEIRRAFVGERQLKADRGWLAEARRTSVDGRIRVTTVALEEDEQGAILEALRSRFASLRESIARNRFTLVGRAPREVDVISRIRAWIEGLPEVVIVAEGVH